MVSQLGDRNASEVIRPLEHPLNAPCHSYPRLPVGERGKLKKPSVVKVYGLYDVRFPQLGLVEIDRDQRSRKSDYTAAQASGFAFLERARRPAGAASSKPRPISNNR